MKLEASQSHVQSDDAVNIHPSRAELSHLSVAESPTSSSRCSCCELHAGSHAVPQGRAAAACWGGSGQAAPSGRYSGGAGGEAAAVAAGRGWLRLCCVSCCSLRVVDVLVVQVVDVGSSSSWTRW